MGDEMSGWNVAGLVAGLGMLMTATAANAATLMPPQMPPQAAAEPTKTATPEAAAAVEAAPPAVVLNAPQAPAARAAQEAAPARQAPAQDHVQLGQATPPAAQAPEAATAASAPAANDSAKTAAANAMDPAKMEDERARGLLAAEARQGSVLHPLQQASPDYSIVVCEAGCGDEQPHIVTKQPKSALHPVNVGPQSDAATATKAGECKGGCVYPVTGVLAQGGAKMLNVQAGDWMTSVAPTKPVTIKLSPRAGKQLRDDWMARINREREPAKEDAAPAQDGAAPAAEPAETEHAVEPKT